MNIQEEFEKWYQVEVNFMLVSSEHPEYDASKLAWNACTKLMQADIDRQDKEIEALRGFANELCEVVFDGGSLDGSDIQDMMLEHGLLIAEIMNEPCEKGSSSCRCQEYCSSEDFRNGVECYRKTPVLKGEL